MGYQHGRTAAPTPTLSVEQSRRRNAELRIELSKLAAEHAHLAPKIEAMRRDLTAARKKLTRQIRDLAVVRAQTEHFAAAAADKQAALDHATTAIETSRPDAPKRRPGPRLTHGKRAMYETGCNCDPCLDWRRNKTAAEKVRAEARRAAGNGIAA